MKSVGALYGIMVVLITGVFVSPATMAQFLDPFWSSRFGSMLTGQDVQYLLARSSELNNLPDAQPGQSMSCSNPDTKAHGTAELTRIYDRDGMICHSLRYRNTPPQSYERIYNLDWCKTSEGWKTMG